MNWQVRELEEYICTLYDPRDQLKNHVFNRSDKAFARGDQDRDQVLTKEQVRARQGLVREAFLKSIGGLPKNSTSLDARVLKISQAGEYKVENIVFQARPNHYITSNLYLPYEGKHSSYYHEVCLRFVQAGLIVFAIDPIGQGERLSFIREKLKNPPWGTNEHQRLGIQSYVLGESVARYFVHDAIRALDYLLTRKEVDPKRIGVTGNSGGGTQTSMLMLCDDRLAAAAPATFIMNRKMYMHAGGVQDAEQVWPSLSAQGFDHEDILLSFAPKPLLILAVSYDFFPIEATRRTVTRAQRFWDILGDPGKLKLVEDVSVHRYTDRLALSAANFFRQEFLGRQKLNLGISSLTPLSKRELLCTQSGQVVIDFSKAQTVANENFRRSQELARLRLSKDASSRDTECQKWLSKKVLANRKICAFNLRQVDLGQVADLKVRYLFWWSQSDLLNSAYSFSSMNRDKLTKKIIGLWPGGTTALQEYWSWILTTCRQEQEVFVLNCSGVGPLRPHPIYGKPSDEFFGTIHKLNDDLLWLDDSLAALRIYDLIRSVELILTFEENKSNSIDVYAADLFILYAKLAAKLEKRIHLLEGKPSFTSISDLLFQQFFVEQNMMSIVLPGILNYFDFTDGKGV